MSILTMSIFGPRTARVLLVGVISLCGGCQTMPTGIQNARVAMRQRIAAEPAGDYYIGRRYFKPDFKFWGYVRRPNQSWSTAKLVTLKAYRQALAAFRAQNQKPWKQCAPDDFRNYLFTIMKRGQARSYVRLQFSALRAFYKFLTNRKKLRIDPLQQLQLPKIDKKLPLVLTRQQIEELLAAPLKTAKQRAAPEWMPMRDDAA